MKATTAPVFAYLRVSSVGQTHGDGFDRQEAAIKKWAKANQRSITAAFRERGVSGTTDHLSRPALTQLFDEIATLPPGTAATVVVEKADRLARDLIVSELLLRHFRELGVTVIEAEGGNDLTVDSGNPTGTLVRQILAAVAQFEKSALVLKLRAARERKKAETGRCGGKYPFGHYPGEKETLAVIVSGHRAYYSTRTIATILNERNLPSRGGKPWTHGAVARILKNQKS